MERLPLHHHNWWPDFQHKPNLRRRNHADQHLIEHHLIRNRHDHRNSNWKRDWKCEHQQSEAYLQVLTAFLSAGEPRAGKYSLVLPGTNF